MARDGGQGPSEFARSKRKLQGELDGARAANLVERIETAVCAARAEATCQGLRRMAEERTGQAVIGRPEIGMIENVEELRSEPQVPLLGERKLPLESHVRLRCPKAAQHVAPEITLSPLRCRFERVFVKNLAAGILRAEKLKRVPWHNVRAGSQGGATREVNGANNVIGRSGPSQNEGVHRPASQRSSGKPVPLRCRQAVGHTCGEGMPDVKVRIPAVYALIRTAARRIEVVGEGIGRSVINRVSERVRGKGLQTS